MQQSQLSVNLWSSHNIKYNFRQYMTLKYIIEQVTDFKFLGFRTSEYGSDLEDKLLTYNKINGVIR